MKTVLRDAKSGLLFKNMDEWTADKAEAAGFKDTLAALKFCQRHGFMDVAVVRHFDDALPERIVGFHRKGYPRTTPPTEVQASAA
jgi:hypothetical protein